MKKRRHWSKHHSQLALLALALLIFVVWMWNTPEPEVLSAVDAETEYVSFTVPDPTRAAFFLPTATVAATGWQKDQTATGLFVAVSGATITYRRNDPGKLTIEVAPPANSTDSTTGTLESTTRDVVAFTGRVGFVIAITPDRGPPPRLPIWGHMSLGLEFAAPALPRPPDARLLLKGKLTVSGVSTGDDGSVLFPITQIDLPLGSRLKSADPPAGSPGRVTGPPLWWGTVSVKPDQSNLNVVAVSESSRVALYRPGKPTADVIEVSTTAKLTHDPNRLRHQILIAVVLSGFGLIASIAGRLHSFAVIFYRKRKPVLNKGVNSLPAILLVCSCLLVRPANAEIVRLTVGDNAFGQGWLFWDTDTVCKVVTARHVLDSHTGQLRAPRVVDSHGAEHTTGPAIVDAPLPYDIAVLPVIAGDPKQVCGTGRLSPIGIERRLQTSSRLVVDTTGRTEIRHVPASLAVAKRDAAGGEFFSLRLDSDAGQAAEGWSGSIVLDAEGPLGIIQRLAPNSDRDLIALRLDIVRRLMQAAPLAATSAPSTKPIIDLTKGSTIVSPGEGGGQPLLDGTGVWRVRPSASRIDFSLTFAKPVDLRGAVLTFGTQSAKSVKGAGLETVGDLAYPDAVGDRPYQRRTGEQAAYTLHVAPRTIRQIRFSIGTEGNEAIDLINLQLF